MQVTLHHTGFILGVPGEHSPGMYEVENGEIVGFSPLGAPSAEEEIPHLVISESVNVVEKPLTFTMNGG